MSWSSLNDRDYKIGYASDEDDPAAYLIGYAAREEQAFSAGADSLGMDLYAQTAYLPAVKVSEPSPAVVLRRNVVCLCEDGMTRFACSCGAPDADTGWFIDADVAIANAALHQSTSHTGSPLVSQCEPSETERAAYRSFADVYSSEVAR